MQYNAPWDQLLLSPPQTNAGYINGNPAAGIAGSIVNANGVEYTQREIINAIIAAGLTPTNGDLTQLAQAIKAIASSVQPAGFALTGSAGQTAVTASWTASRLTAAVSLGGESYTGFNLSLAFNGSIAGVNGMDTGTLPASADLSIYAIYNPTTQIWSTLGCLGTVSRGAVYGGAHMPSGYTASVLIWAGVTTSGLNGGPYLPSFYQLNRSIFILPSLVLAGGTVNSVFQSLSVATYVPAAALTCAGPCGITSTVSNTISIAGNNAGTVAAQPIGAGAGDQWCGSTNTASSNNGNYMVPLIAPQTIWYAMNAGGTTSGSVWVSSYTI